MDPRRPQKLAKKTLFRHFYPYLSHKSSSQKIDLPPHLEGRFITKQHQTHPVRRFTFHFSLFTFSITHIIPLTY